MERIRVVAAAPGRGVADVVGALAGVGRAARVFGALRRLVGRTVSFPLVAAEAAVGAGSVRRLLGDLLAARLIGARRVDGGFVVAVVACGDSVISKSVTPSPGPLPPTRGRKLQEPKALRASTLGTSVRRTEETLLLPMLGTVNRTTEEDPRARIVPANPFEVGGATGWPDGFALTAERRGVATRLGVRNVEAVWDHFRAWAGARGRRHTAVGWEAAWRNWCHVELRRWGNRSAGVAVGAAPAAIQRALRRVK